MFDVQTEQEDCECEGKRVDVYKNIQDECISIMSRESGTDEYGSVIGHTDFALLTDVDFVVQNCGQQKVRDTEQKNVHAFVRGEMVATGLDAEMEWNMMVRLFENDIVNVTYDPYETDHFEVVDAVDVTEHDMQPGDEIHGATYASVTTDGVGALLPAEQ